MKWNQAAAIPSIRVSSLLPSSRPRTRSRIIKSRQLQTPRSRCHHISAHPGLPSKAQHDLRGDKMEHFRRGVEFGMASFQRCHSVSCQMAENTQVDAEKAGFRRKDKSSRRQKGGNPAEMPVVPEQAMEFLSRTWSPSSSDLFQILSPSSLGASGEGDQEGETKEDEDGEKDLDTVRFDGGKGHLFNQFQTWRVLASGKSSSKQRKHKLNQPTWLNVGQMRAILRGYFLDNVSVTGSRRRRRRDEVRLHSAQAHAAVSVAQLAAAIAGIVSACELRRGAEDKKLCAVLASAATLVATVCAEAAESAGANRPRVTSAVKSGLESRSSAELLTLTATAATCLRGAAALKLRAADVRGIRGGGGGGGGDAVAISITASIQKGIALRICLPCGKVRVRTVSILPRHGGTVALKLGKKRLGGAFATYDNYEVLGVSSSVAGEGGEAVVVDGRGCFPVALGTSAGTVRLLLEDQTHCKVWKAAIEGMLSD